MKTFLSSAGVLLIAGGVSTLILFAFSSGLVVIGLTPELSAVLAIGGLLSIGMSGVIAAIERQALATRPGTVAVPAPAVATAAPVKASDSASISALRREPSVPPPSSAHSYPPRLPDESLASKFRAVAEAAGGASAPATAAAVAATMPRSALAAPAESEDTAPVSEEDLFVVAEHMIAGRPARILSDNTVEAETEDGWMRFENMEHLEEYLGIGPSS